MSFKNDFVDDINEKLSEKRTPDDIQSSLSIPEHKFKKISEKFNYALKAVYDNNKENDVKMFHIILSLQNYFTDMNTLVDNILNEENKEIIEIEMNEEYNIEKNTKKNKKRTKKNIKTSDLTNKEL